MGKNRVEYLGDGVYVDFDGYQLGIWTSDGATDSGKIYLEPAVLNALVGYYKRVSKK